MAAPPSKTITIIDGTSGTRREVQIPFSADEKPAAPEKRANSRLSETTQSIPAPRTRQTDRSRPQSKPAARRAPPASPTHRKSHAAAGEVRVAEARPGRFYSQVAP